jgi:hypothetical protein
MTTPASFSDHRGMVTGLFSGKVDAECAYQSAVQLGYDKSDINLAMSDETRQRCFSGEHRVDSDLSDKAAESSDGSSKLADELGGATGGAIGTLAPVLAAVGTLALIPGVAIAGPVALALTAAGAVGLAGGLIGALSNWGIPEDRIHQFEAGIRRGAILLGVKPRSDADANELKRRWRAFGGELHSS